MRALLAPDIVRMWEVGRDQAPIERAISLLAIASTESSRAELRALPVSRRDSQLLELRKRTFGDALNAFSQCPQCTGRLEIRFAATDIKSSDGETPDTLEITSHGTTVRFRLPTSIDLAETIAGENIDQASEALFSRCVIEARKDGEIVGSHELPEEVREEINRRMATADPAAEVLLNLQCPLCTHSWQAFFDIASFFWTEISAHARRLLHEVDALARIYGWSETEILGLSAVRRQAYLELIA
jgi:hypothetical protein